MKIKKFNEDLSSGEKPVLYNELDNSVAIFKEQQDLVKDIKDKSNTIIDEIIKTDELNDLVKYYDIIVNLPGAAKIYNRVNDLMNKE